MGSGRDMTGSIHLWVKYWEQVRDNLAVLTCPELPESYDRVIAQGRVIAGYREAEDLWTEQLEGRVSEVGEKLRRAFFVFYQNSVARDPLGWQRCECEICQFVDGGYRQFIDWNTQAGTRATDAPLPDGDPPGEPRPFVDLLGTSLGRLRWLYRKSERMLDDNLAAMTEEELKALHERVRERERVQAMPAGERVAYIESRMTAEEREKYTILPPIPGPR